MQSPEIMISEGQLIFSIVLAAITVWYAYETARLRKVSQQQQEIADKQSKISERQISLMEASLNLTKASFDATLLPYLILGIVALTDDIRLKYGSQPKTSYINLPGFGAINNNLEHDDKLIFSVINATEKLASHIFMIYFDLNRQVYISCMVIESIGPKEEIFIPLSKYPVAPKDLKQVMGHIFEGRGQYLFEKTEDVGEGLPKISIIDKYVQSEERHLVTVFFDLAGKLYAIPRLVFEGEKGFDFGKSDLIQDRASFFAPTFESSAASAMFKADTK